MSSCCCEELIRVRGSCSGSSAASPEAAGSVCVPGVRSPLCPAACREGGAA